MINMLYQALAGNQAQGAPKPQATPTPKDDVPYNPQAAAELEKGATQSGVQPTVWLANLKEGLGIGKKQPK